MVVRVCVSVFWFCNSHLYNLDCIQCWSQIFLGFYSFSLLFLCQDLFPGILIPYSYLIFLLYSLLCSLKCFLPFSFWYLKTNKKNIYCLNLHFLYYPPLFFSLHHRLRLILSISQSRIPGTVIPLCAAQCERIFNTTRIPGEETGKETDLNTHVETQRTDVWVMILKKQTSLHRFLAPLMSFSEGILTLQS